MTATASGDPNPTPAPGETEAGRLVVLAGPTAAGKSALALDLAGQLDAEIVNADAMALYIGMEIGTARTPPAERRGIPHHQIDVLEVSQNASVAAYQHQARADIEQIWARGKTALLVGGSGLYVRAVTDPVVFPPTDPQVRAKWERLGEEQGAEYLAAELARLDPVAAAHIEPANIRRLVRALEAIELTGQPFAAQLPAYSSWRPATMVALDLDVAELDQRIEQRAAWMIAAGLVEEVAELRRRFGPFGRTAARGIGYAEALAVLDGELATELAEQSIAAATKRLARRQRKWFRRDPRFTWLQANQPDLPKRICEAVV
ncbi:MAG: tRNA (adenosine(37)-N6)-dimethylallyltransferase MiaA [Bifidobacteriaceae bacterium]|nr:tRNA (adenosine(37)-N6)-dimethylallyltransferase MiaA [Bifidobacteriaceae bacterium]